MPYETAICPDCKAPRRVLVTCQAVRARYRTKPCRKCGLARRRAGLNRPGAIEVSCPECGTTRVVVAKGPSALAFARQRTCTDCRQRLAMGQPREGESYPCRHAGLPLPAAPTRALPGTLDKVEELAARVERGEQLFHPADAGRRGKVSNALACLCEREEAVA